ncbi:MAG: adenine deaminase [Saprospiraceae bacterium]|nr:adenine deaminase [Saprospiraceae bacterium]
MIIQLVDLHERRIYPAEITIDNGRIQKIRAVGSAPEGSGYLLPGFVDAHVHVESSMLPPAEFARMAVVHGTVATVSDPHEIANVLGTEGVEYMLADAARTPFKFCFGAPSCVPATAFETAGAALKADAVEALLKRPDIGYLSEMMNFPGVLHGDAEVMAKIAAAGRLGKPVDGHAPGLRGDDAKRYFAAGIETDHECFTYEEGLDKARLGVKILIREGSAARNFEALWPLIGEFPEQVMFCSDDKHPDDLVRGHIDELVVRALEKGCNLFDVLQAACLNPVLHYRLPVGLLREGDPADFVRVADLKRFKVLETWLNGEKVAENGRSLLPRIASEAPNHFNALPKSAEAFQVSASTGNGSAAKAHVKVIGALDGQIVTESLTGHLPVENGLILADPANDMLKISVVNRYALQAVPATGFVKGFGIKGGALASSVVHDSHNIIAVGTDDDALCAAVNAVIGTKGGISAVDRSGNAHVLPLPIAGLMSQADGYALAQEYAELDAWVKNTLGCSLRAPFMVLSFLALPVIPKLKMTDLGLFDVDQFCFVPVEMP